VLFQTTERTDDGQATIALAGVLAVACFAGLAVALIGHSMVNRASARNAADAVALAVVDDVVAADGLRDWYLDQGVIIDLGADRTTARSGPSQAAAWARLDERRQQPAPVLIAILARAEQLLGLVFHMVRWHEMSFELPVADARQLASVAVDLGLCEPETTAASPEWKRFFVC